MPASGGQQGPSKLGLQTGVLFRPRASAVSWRKGSQGAVRASHQQVRMEKVGVRQEKRERKPSPEHVGEIMASDKACK